MRGGASPLCTPQCEEGLRPSGSKPSDLAPAPRSGGLRPPEQVVRLGSCSHQWAYPAHTRGSFRFTTKGTKGVPGLCPWTP